MAYAENISVVPSDMWAFHGWMHNHHPEVYTAWIINGTEPDAYRYCVSNCPHIVVEWRMSR